MRRRRICRVLVAARFYLHQTDEVLLRRHLASELDEAALAPVVDADATDVLPQIAASQVVSPPSAPGGSPRASQPDLDHGGAGQPAPRRPRPRRVPPPGNRTRPPSGGNPLALSSGAAWQA
ncbi:MAG: hypothetical protein GEU83_12945 [Pseudonocardiaceae bacterium]|nr:hypothetical protein [Pseudonocardiaceae bacterium]